jgi:hypothetical protein
MDYEWDPDKAVANFANTGLISLTPSRAERRDYEEDL